MLGGKKPNMICKTFYQIVFVSTIIRNIHLRPYRSLGCHHQPLVQPPFLCLKTVLGKMQPVSVVMALYMLWCLGSRTKLENLNSNCQSIKYVECSFGAENWLNEWSIDMGSNGLMYLRVSLLGLFVKKKKVTDFYFLLISFIRSIYNAVFLRIERNSMSHGGSAKPQN